MYFNAKTKDLSQNLHLCNVYLITTYSLEPYQMWTQLVEHSSKMHDFSQFFAILKPMYLENELADPPLFLYQKIAQKPTYRLVLVRYPWKIFWRQKWQNPKKQFFFKNWLNN